MKKMNKSNKLLSTILAVSMCYVVSGLFSPANALDASPASNFAGYGYTHGQIPVMNEIGGASIHDADLMRYERNSRMREMDYSHYENTKNGTDGSPVSNYADSNGGDPYMKATIDEVGSQGVYVNSIEVSPSEILSRDEINSVIGQYVGRNVFMTDIQNAINGLNNLYAEKGFVTARAYLPEQTVSNGNIKIELIESRIGNVSVLNNKYTTDNYILKRIPEKSGQLFDIVDLEKDVLDFNRYHDGVNLTANLKAGTVPGTTDIELTAHETFPFHLIGMMDNAGRRSTGHLRGGPALVADSLFHHRDQMSMGSYFSKGAISPFFDYSVPINKKDGRIGFSFSSTFAKVKYGPAYLTNLGLKSNSYIYSLYYDQPIVRTRGFEFKTYAAMNYKRARTWSKYDGIMRELFGFSPFNDKDEVTSLDIGFNLRKDTKYGIWYFNQMASQAFPIFDSDSSYFKYSGGLLRLHDFGHGFIGQIRGNYQVIPGKDVVPYADQMTAGGMNTVRGYSEGLLIGKNGYILGAELQFPIMARAIKSRDKSHYIPFLGSYLKGFTFLDFAVGSHCSARRRTSASTLA